MSAWNDFKTWSGTIATGGADTPAEAVPFDPGLPTKEGLETTADMVSGTVQKVVELPGKTVNWFSDFFSGIKWTVILIIVAVLFIGYVFAKNSKIKSIA